MKLHIILQKKNMQGAFIMVHFSEQIGAFKYMEVSALTMEGVKELFLEVIKVAVHGQGGDEKKGCCTIL